MNNNDMFLFTSPIIFTPNTDILYDDVTMLMCIPVMNKKMQNLTVIGS